MTNTNVGQRREFAARHWLPRRLLHDSGMRIAPGHNAFDRQLDGLPPAEFLRVPQQFGYDPDAPLRDHEGAAPSTLLAAAVQHQLACFVRAEVTTVRRQRLLAAYEVPAQTFGRVLRGHQWAGPKTAAALVMMRLPELISPRSDLGPHGQ